MEITEHGALVTIHLDLATVKRMQQIAKDKSHEYNGSESDIIARLIEDGAAESALQYFRHCKKDPGK